MSENVVEVRGLVHRFGDLTAVDDISFDVRRGEIFSFLGPNGAGKSTTINVLTTLLPCQAGTVTVCGHDIRKETSAVKSRIGIVFQDMVLDRDLTVWETLEFHGRIYSMPKTLRAGRIDELLKLVDLEGKRGERVKNLSGGMKRRLEIARGLMTRPEILYLDEPTIGLDPQTRLRIWDYIKNVNREGTTIFLTTHYMDEADQLSDRIHIIDHGRLIASGTPETLKSDLGTDMVYLVTGDDDATEPLVSAIEGVRSVKQTTKGLELILDEEGGKLLPRIIHAIEDGGVDIESVMLKRPSLDDVFVHHTGREVRDEPAHTNIKQQRFRRH